MTSYKRDFGSFHVSNVQELINLPEKDYSAPVLPLKVPCFDGYKEASFPFGSEAGRRHFLLEEKTVFLNHGAFGAVLKDALEVAQQWQRYIERQPLRFFDRELLPHLVNVTRRLAAFVGSDPGDLVLVSNVTTAINCVLKSRSLNPGDEVVHFSLEYGAVKKILSERCAECRADVIQCDIRFPITDNTQVVKALESKLSERTRLVVVDHIPSNTPCIMPVKAIVDLCHHRDIPVLVDGAHALGQLDLDLRALGADFYTSNCHKWLSSPKGAAFLRVERRHQQTTRPLTVSHGYGSGFNSEFIWAGLRDYSAFLALTTVLDFWISVGPDRIREYIHRTAAQAAARLVARWDSSLLVPPHMSGSMICVQLPDKLFADEDSVDYSLAERAQNALYSRYDIEVPVKAIQGRLYVRISAHVYNTADHFETLGEAVIKLQADGLHIAGQGI